MRTVLVPRPTRFVAFAGTRAAQGPLTFGQLNVLEWLNRAPADAYTSIEWALDIPDGATVDKVADALAVLLSRHEGLRTVYYGGPRPHQRVLPSGELPVEIYSADTGSDVPVDPSALIAEIFARIRVGSRTVCNESQPLPLRVALLVGGGSVRACAISYSHLAVDYRAVTILGQQLTELIREPRPAQPAPIHQQPVDRALWERGPDLRRRRDTTLRYWQEQLRLMPPCPYPVRRTGTEGESLVVELSSSAAGRALTRIAARTRASRPTIVLAAICAVLSVRTGETVWRFPVMSGNRFDPRAAEYVGTLAQSTIFAVDLADAGFDQMVRRTTISVSKANRRALYDVYDRLRISEQLRRERGVDLPFEPVFNSIITDSVPADRRFPAPPAPPVDEASRLRRQRMLPLSSPLRFDLTRIESVMVCTAWSGDTGLVDAAELESLLLAVERLLVAAAARDLDPAATRRAVGLTPIERGPGWLRVNGCWIELAEAQRLLDDALGPGVGRVFPDGPHLVAYLGTGPTRQTPEQVHDQCVRALPGRFTRMTPTHYVLCAGVPDHLTDLTAWRRLPVVAAGDGR
jgi:hypothetical protein